MTKLTGLTNQEVAELTRAGLYNKPVEAPSKTVEEIVKSNLFTYFNFVFLVITILLILVGSFRDLTFLPIIIANTVIGIVQEIRSKQILDKLNVLNAPRARVVRAGKEHSIPTEELVLGDIVHFRAGDQIPADAELVEGELSMSEALLTGEEDEITKKPSSELLSGSFVVNGEGYAKLTKVGAESYISKLTLKAKAIKNTEQSEIIRSLNIIVKLAGIAIIPIGIILFAQGYIFGDLSIRASVQSMVAAVIGMIPEGLFLLASVTLVISATKLALDKVLLHDMKSIETLARIDVLCVDKTGTITDGQMTIEKIIPLNKSYSQDLLAKFVQSQSSDNVTILALQEKFGKNKALAETPEKVYGFTSKYKYSATAFKDHKLVLGAPDLLMADASATTEYTERGLRTLVFGKYSGELGQVIKPAQFTPLAFITMSNHIRKSARETFQYFDEQGVRIIVISGDDPVTVSAVAKEAGIKNAEHYIDFNQVEDLAQALNDYTVFGRVTPEGKRQMVQLLQEQKHTVAMTGDGVNDILAMKDADCSVAMATGSDAAIQASELVLLESDFSKMPHIVAEGRRVVNNLERSGSLFLVKNIFSLMTALLAICFSFTYPILPTQISMVTLFTIGIPSFFLAQIGSKKLIKGNFISNILKSAIPAGVTDVVLVGTMVGIGGLFNLSVNNVATACTGLIALVGIIYLYRVCTPFDWPKRLIFFGCLIGLVLSFIFLKDLFGLERNMDLLALASAIVIALTAFPLLSAFTKLVDKIWQKTGLDA